MKDEEPRAGSRKKGLASKNPRGAPTIGKGERRRRGTRREVFTEKKQKEFEEAPRGDGFPKEYSEERLTGRNRRRRVTMDWGGEGISFLPSESGGKSCSGEKSREHILET